MADMSKFSPDDGLTVLNVKDSTARSRLEEMSNSLGTASTKNAISVVTDSSDLVESGAVKDIVGCGNKNLCNPYTFVQGLITHETGIIDSGNMNWISSDYIPCSGKVTISGWKDGNESNYSVRFAEYNSNKNFIKDTVNVNVSDEAYYNRTITLDSNTRFVRITQGFNNKACNPSTYFAVNRVQIEKGSTATSYEPYHASVKDTLRDAEVIEGKNLLAFNLSDLKEYSTSGTWSGNVYTRNGVTFTYDESDNSITVNGTATGGAGVLIIKPSWFSTVISTITDEVATGGGYIISDGKNGRIGNADLYLRNDGSYVYIQLSSGKTANNVKLYPMIRLASETDPTYEPYYTPLKDVVPIKMSYVDNGVLGAKNLLNIPKTGYKNASAPNVTAVINDDGSVVVNGQVTNAINFFSFVRRAVDDFKLSINSKYIVSIETSNEAVDISIGYTHPTTGSYVDFARSAKGATELEFTTPAESEGMPWTIQLEATLNTSFSNYKIYPMLRLATDPDSTYQPYAQTNRELTVNKADNSVIGTVEGANASKAWSVGEHFIKDGAFKEVTQPIASGGDINDSNTVDKPIADLLNVESGTITAYGENVTISNVFVQKYGNVVCAKFSFNLTNAITSDANTLLADISLIPYSNNLPIITLISSTIPYAPLECIAWINASGNITLRANLPAGSYQGYVTYICK